MMATDTDRKESLEADEFIPTRRSLLSRLRDWYDRESWREFFETYWRLIFSVCVKSGLPEEDARDVVQETVLSVAKQMLNFRYDPQKGSFKAWLLQITQRRIVDHLRARPAWQARRKAGASPEAALTSRIACPIRIPCPWNPCGRRNGSGMCWKWPAKEIAETVHQPRAGLSHEAPGQSVGASGGATDGTANERRKTDGVA